MVYSTLLGKIGGKNDKGRQWILWMQNINWLKIKKVEKLIKKWSEIGKYFMP